MVASATFAPTPHQGSADIAGEDRGKTASFKMCSIKKVVVVFRFDPGNPASSGPLRKRSAQSPLRSQIVTPFARAAWQHWSIGGHAGNSNESGSCSRNVFSRWAASTPSLNPRVRSGRNRFTDFRFPAGIHCRHVRAP